MRFATAISAIGEIIYERLSVAAIRKMRLTKAARSGRREPATERLSAVLFYVKLVAVGTF